MRISYVIRTYNEEKYIGMLLDILLTQKLQYDSEIIIVDSQSSDGTVKIAEEYSTIIYKIPKLDFSYSRSLNFGIEKSSGDLVFLLSAHAIPENESFSLNLIKNFENPCVGGVYARQIPRAEANWKEIIRLEKYFGKERKIFKNWHDIKDLHFSNAASCIRRSVWENCHFDENVFAAEDVVWAEQIIKNGYEIVYDSEVKIYHSHEESNRKAGYRHAELVFAKYGNIGDAVLLKRALGWFIKTITLAVSTKYLWKLHYKILIESLLQAIYFYISFLKIRKNNLRNGRL